MAALLISATSYADNPLQSQGRIEYGEGTNKVVFDANDLVNIDERMVSAYASLNDLKADIYGGTKTDGTVISTGLFDYRDQMDSYTAERIADLQEKYDALENSLGLYAEGLKSQLQNYATRAETAATAAEQAYTDVSNAAAQVNTAKTNALSAVDTAKANALAALVVKEGELETDLSAHESDLEGQLTSHKTTLAGQLDGYITTAQGLLSDTENARDEAAGTANALTSAVTTINQYDDRLTDLEGKTLTPETLDNYYTKTQADGKFLTNHQSLASYYTKSEVDGKTSSISTLNSDVTAIKNSLYGSGGNASNPASDSIAGSVGNKGKPGYVTIYIYGLVNTVQVGNMECVSGQTYDVRGKRIQTLRSNYSGPVHDSWVYENDRGGYSSYDRLWGNRWVYCDVPSSFNGTGSITFMGGYYDAYIYKDSYGRSEQETHTYGVINRTGDCKSFTFN